MTPASPSTSASTTRRDPSTPTGPATAATRGPRSWATGRRRFATSPTNRCSSTAAGPGSGACRRCSTSSASGSRSSAAPGRSSSTPRWAPTSARPATTSAATGCAGRTCRSSTATPSGRTCIEAVASITATCGSRPVGWYAKAPPSLSTRELLIEEGGFLYDSDSFADDLPYFVEVTGQRHLVIPYTFVTNDSRYLPGAGLRQPHRLPGQLPARVRRVVARGRRASQAAHHRPASTLDRPAGTSVGAAGVPRARAHARAGVVRAPRGGGAMVDRPS